MKKNKKIFILLIVFTFSLIKILNNILKVCKYLLFYVKWYIIINSYLI